MNKDLIIGVISSVVIHILAIDPQGWFDAKKVEEQVEVVQAAKVELMEMPEIEPPEPEVREAGDEPEEAPPEFAPPMQQDVPSLVTVDTPFQQVMAPPPPPSTPTSSGAITVPVNRNIGTGKIADLFDIKDLDQVPQATYQPQPQYPYEMKRAGVSGKVDIGFICDSSGNVRDPYIIKSSSPEFEEPALQAIRKWRFRPGKKGGKAVNTKMKQPMSFNLEDAK